MNSQPDRLESIFADALALPAEARAAYLDQASGGDAELRRRVGALLQAHAEAGSFLERPAIGAVVTSEPPAEPWLDREAAPVFTEGPGTHIGPYKLLLKLGEGGMGMIYMAEQQEPIRRKVALKIIKPGMDSASHRPLRSRAPGAGDDGASEHRSGLRWRRDRERPALFRHGSGQGFPNHALLRRKSADAARAAGTVRAGLPGGAARPSERHHPPRPKAVQRPS